MTNRYRTLFISDVHLGSPHSKANELLNFLFDATADTIVIAGDFLDDTVMVDTWPKSHRHVVMLLFRRIAEGARVIYVPGNHDAAMDGFFGTFGNLSIKPRYSHALFNGKSILVIHGDICDTLPSHWFPARLDHWLPVPFWEMLRKMASRWMRAHIDKFRMRALRMKGWADYVLCGHVHFPELTGSYLNTGDWVRHCTAIVEKHDGALQLINHKFLVLDSLR